MSLFFGPLLPFIFRLQFGYCYSFCPATMPSADSVVIASQMRKRHRKEANEAWTVAQQNGMSVAGIPNKHGGIASP